MKNVLASMALCALGTSQTTEALAQAYTPQQAMSVFRDAIREVVSPGGPASSWFSLSMIGAIAEPEDITIVNDLANFCPEPSPVITSFKRTRQLDRTYQTALEGMVGPLRPATAEYIEAKKFLFNGADETAEYKAYQKAGEAYADALTALHTESDPKKRTGLLQKVVTADQKWATSGYKGEVDAAFLQIAAGETKFGSVKNGQRNRVLQWYKTKGLIPNDTAGAYRAPASELSPPVATWANEGGWLSVSYSNNQTSSRYSESSSKSSGFGGLNLGFLTLVGSGGGGDGTTTRVGNVTNFSYSFEVKPVIISRPWLDTEVFFEPRGWTWRKSASTQTFPRVSEGPDAAGAPVPAANTVYNYSGVDCPMMPNTLIIARKRNLTATVSKSDYELIKASGSAGGGGSLFGIFGGGAKRTWSTTTVSENQNDVTFKVDAPGIAVIGVVSELIPRAPNGNVADKWPDNAWLEEKK